MALLFIIFLLFPRFISIGGIQDLMVTLSITLDGSLIDLKMPIDAPPYAAAVQICNQYNLFSTTAPEMNCETIISSEIHRIQSNEMALHGSGGRGVHQGEYFLKSNLMEHELMLRGHSISEGHVGLSSKKVDYLSRLSGSPLIQNIVQVGLNAGHSAIIFLESNPNAVISSIDSIFHEYTRSASNILTEWYRDRHFLTIGRSQDVLFSETHIRTSKNQSLVPWYNTDLYFIDGDHTYDAALSDILNGCSLLAPRCDTKREMFLVMDDVGPGCHFQPVDGIYSANSCEASSAWKDAIARGVIVELDSMDAHEYNRITSLVVGKCICDGVIV